MRETASQERDNPLRFAAEQAGSVLYQALKWLDQCLDAQVQNAYPAETARHHLDELDKLLVLSHPAAATSFQWLAQTFGLTLVDVALLIVALAPEVDLRYQRIYAALQDDPNRKRPSVDFALKLLASSSEDAFSARARLSTVAPLIQQNLIVLVEDCCPPQPFIGRSLVVDAQIVNLILNQKGIDTRLQSFATFERLQAQHDPTVDIAALLGWDGQQSPPCIYLQGRSRIQKRDMVAGLADHYKLQVLVVELDKAAMARDFNAVMALAMREAWLHHALLYCTQFDALDESFRRVVVEQAATAKRPVVLEGQSPWQPGQYGSDDVLPFVLDQPTFADQYMMWRSALINNAITYNTADLEMLAGRLRLTPEQINQAVRTVALRRQWDDGEPAEDLCNKLFRAVRAQTGHQLGKLAQKIDPLYTWEDIVLPQDALQQLHELCTRVALQHRVLDEWGFSNKLAHGKGVTVLFAGPPGTGKTMAAEIVAQVLGLSLYKIDLSGVVSKYIGETEKNLSQIFDAAENAILFFDEADALFGKRSEVKDAHDRYANIEISYLLQRMEAYDGVAILATNLQQNLDQAFIRRLTFAIHFPFPDMESRYRIWESIWPSLTPLADDVDMWFLAQHLKVSGGNIKNIALAAAFLAAEDAEMVQMVHILHAAHREFQKMGQVLALPQESDRASQNGDHG